MYSRHALWTSSMCSLTSAGSDRSTDEGADWAPAVAAFGNDPTRAVGASMMRKGAPRRFCAVIFNPPPPPASPPAPRGSSQSGEPSGSHFIALRIWRIFGVLEHLLVFVWRTIA